MARRPEFGPSNLVEFCEKGLKRPPYRLCEPAQTAPLRQLFDRESALWGDDKRHQSP
jgi:hypothetical protein